MFAYAGSRLVIRDCSGSRPKNRGAHANPGGTGSNGNLEVLTHTEATFPKRLPKALCEIMSAFRAMNKAALEVYTTLRQEGTQASLIDKMQTRAELYDFLGYHAFEQKLDELFQDQTDRAS